MPAITSSNVAQAIVKLVAADALPALMGNLVMGNLVNRNYEPVLGQAGDTVNIPIAPTMVANNIAEGGTVQTQNPNVGNAQIVLNTHAEATFQVPDVTKLLAVPDLLKVYMEPAVVAIAERIETDLLNLYPQFTVNSTLGTPGVSMTEADIDAAETALFQAKVPASQPKHLMVDADAYSALRQIPRFSEYQSAGEAGVNALVSGRLVASKTSRSSVRSSCRRPALVRRRPTTWALHATRSDWWFAVCPSLCREPERSRNTRSSATLACGW